MDISIIIPFHKGLHYLSDSLDSLLAQTISKDCFEVIIIFDEKWDSEDLQTFLLQYESKLNIYSIKMNKKYGVAAARNIGISQARGNYIYFLDSDDYLMEHTLEFLLAESRSGLKIIYGKNVNTWFKRSTFLQQTEEPTRMNDISIPGSFDYIFHKRLTVLNALIDRQFIQTLQERFKEDLIWYSDLPFLISLLDHTEEIASVTAAIYVKRKHNDEINLPSLSQVTCPNQTYQYIEAYETSLAKVSIHNELNIMLGTMLCKYVIAKFTDNMHTKKRKPVWTEEQFQIVAKALSAVNKESKKKFTTLEKIMLHYAAKGKSNSVMMIGNLIVIGKKKKGLFGNHIQRARALDRFVFHRLDQKDNWIVFESFLGKNYSDSCKYIYEYMLEQYGSKYRYIWVINDKKAKIPGNPIKVKRFSYRYFYYFARSKYWVSNMRQPIWMEKHKETVFLETWHGTPLKKLVFDMEDVHSASPSYKAQFYAQSRDWDYLVSDNRFSTDVFERAFLFDKNKILEYGYPRNDILYKEDRTIIANEIRKRLGIPDEKKTILYAPTWRDDDFYKPGKYKFQLQLDLQKLKDAIGEEYTVLLRTHYFIADDLDLTGVEDFVINVSKYNDISELYLISDICITDYSSVFFDYANLKRPILFFTYDLQKYRDVLRGFYIDIETEMPGPLLYTTEEVISAIQNIHQIEEEYSEQYKLFYDRFCSLDDGFASKRIVEKVFGKN